MSQTTVKISLSAQELAAYGVRFAELDRQSPETAALLADVVAEAERQSRLPLRDARLFVEAFGRPDGSCLLYLSLMDAVAEGPVEAGSAPVLLCDFAEPRTLYACCTRLRSAGLGIARSALYARGAGRDARLRLVLELPAPQVSRAARMLSEFCTVQRGGRVSLGVTAEHFSCVQKQRAVDAVARWTPAGS